MTIFKALATLEFAVLECKRRNIDTPEVRKALEHVVKHGWTFTPN